MADIITNAQYSSFREEIVGIDALDLALDWIKQHLTPEQVFDEQVLIDWAKAGDDPTEIFTEAQLLKWARDRDVEDVCTEADLKSWAEDNGYLKEGELHD